MAKKTKEQGLDMFYDEKNGKKTKSKTGKKKKKIDKVKTEQNDKFSFDNEIIIGVTRKEEPKKQVANKKSNNKKNNIKKSNKHKIENRTTEKVKNNESNLNSNIINNANSKTNNINAKNVKNKNKKKNTKRPINKKQINNNITPEQQEKIIKKRNRNKKIIKISLLFILFIIVILCAMFSPLFDIKTIEVNGNKIVTKNEIISLSKIQIEENSFKLNKGKIKKQIKENAYIQDVKITRKLTSTILIEVEEREPAYLLEYAGSYVVIDKQGYMLEMKTEKISLPIIQGEVTETSNFVVGNRLCTEDLERLAIISRIMELAKVNDIYTIITGIDISNKENIKLIFETEEKVAYLGDSTNMNTKILMIKSILEKEEGKPGEIFLNFDLNKKNPIFRERV